MHAFTILLAGAITLASAQSTTTLFLPGLGGPAVFASVVGSDAAATTFALGCLPGESLDKCDLPPSFTLTEGPATAHFTWSMEGRFEQVDCSLGGVTTAFCTVTADPTGTSTFVTSTGLTGALLASQFQIVTLTDSLAAATGSAQTSDGGISASVPGGQSLSEVSLMTGSATPSMTAQTITPSSTGTNAISTTGGSGTSSASAASKTSTAGISQITGNAGWAVGGAALALVVAGL